MKILVSDPISESGLKIIERFGFEVIYLPNATELEKKKASRNVNGWIIRSGTKINSESFSITKSLQVIGRAGVGVDNIDIQESTRKGVVVLNTPDSNTISAAEHTMGLMLALSRNIHLGHISLANDLWDRHKLIGCEMRNKIVGIVGLGKIGKEVITRCLGFKMKVLGYDPFVNQEMFDKEKTLITDLNTLVEKSDYISIHVPLNKQTKNLFNYDLITKMKKSAFLVNVARGGIINEADLTKALNEDKISGAAIDVFKTEPIEKTNPLLDAKNVLLTPHLGASTKEAKEGVSIEICKQVCEYLANDKLINAVNTPISDLAKLHEIKPFLNLSELIGDFLNQLISSDSVKNIIINCQGTAKDTKPILLSFLKGLLKPYVPDRINYINAETIAKELGIQFSVNYSNIETSYKNLISINAITLNDEYRIDGSIFDDKKPRITNVMGYNTEVLPKGMMLLIENIDVPGVIGNVGTFLGKLKVNIGAYLLTREKSLSNAFSIVRIDSRLSKKDILSISEIPEIINVKQIKIIDFDN